MSTNIVALLPEIILTLTGVLIMLAEPCLEPASSRKPLGWIAIAAASARPARLRVSRRCAPARLRWIA